MKQSKGLKSQRQEINLKWSLQKKKKKKKPLKFIPKRYVIGPTEFSRERKKKKNN